MFFTLRKSLFIGLALSVVFPARAEAVTFNFDWTGQVAGFEVSGSFGYDETQSYSDGIVRTENLDFLDISFFAPDGAPIGCQLQERMPTITSATKRL